MHYDYLSPVSFHGLGSIPAITKANVLKQYKQGRISESAYRAWQDSVQKYEKEYAAWQQARASMKKTVEDGVNKIFKDALKAAQDSVKNAPSWARAPAQKALKDVQNNIENEIEKELKKRFLTPEPQRPIPPLEKGAAPASTTPAFTPPLDVQTQDTTPPPAQGLPIVPIAIAAALGLGVFFFMRKKA